ncbi:DNA-directed RNA polymerase subunit beta [Marininema halotolerans]|uniref:DNA-directed RNA polymerase subunit beta n=1 Tax=Marininema halotolerans TaxID=1155944 RepID=A0A1I6P1I2_9BACL|nr:DNA-directed RNA polymerase subunit beta [Marininema halotolerans]SFS34052.1 DNA-directed RNA polymerase subunit beta [Marininema halotolerans]
MQGNDDKQPRVREDGKADKQRVASHEGGDKSLPRREGSHVPEAEKETDFPTVRDDMKLADHKKAMDVPMEDPKAASNRDVHEGQREGATVSQSNDDEKTYASEKAHHSHEDDHQDQSQAHEQVSSTEKNWDDLKVDQKDGIKNHDQDDWNEPLQNWEGHLDQDWGVSPESEMDENRPKPVGELKWKKEEAVGENEEIVSAMDQQEELPSDPNPSQKDKDDESNFSSPEPEDPWTEVEPPGKTKRTRRKVLMFTLVWLPVLSLGMLIGGVLIGYSVIGEGSAGDVFSTQLWEHLYNLIYG